MDLDTILELRGAEVDIDDALRRFNGNSALYEKLLKRFLVDSTFSQIIKAFGGENREDAPMAVHTFKGVAANLGVDKLFNISSFMMGHVRAGRFDEAIEAYLKLEGTYKEICRILANDQRQLVFYGCREEVTICTNGIPY